MKKLMSFFISILFVLSLTGLSFAQAGAPAAPEKDNSAAVEKSDVKAEKATKAKKAKKTKKAKKAKKSKKTKKAKEAAPESDQE